MDAAVATARAFPLAGAAAVFFAGFLLVLTTNQIPLDVSSKDSLVDTAPLRECPFESARMYQTTSNKLQKFPGTIIFLIARICPI